MKKIKIKSVITFEIDSPRIPTDITLTKTQFNDFVKADAESLLIELMGAPGVGLQIQRIRIAQTKGETNE